MAPQRQCLRRALFLDHPFDCNAGVDHQVGHRSSRPSRTKSSAGVWRRPVVSARSSAARASKSISASPLNVWRRMSRTSASAECPCRAARRFNLAIRSSSRLRTLILAIARSLTRSALSDSNDSSSAIGLQGREEEEAKRDLRHRVRTVVEVSPAADARGTDRTQAGRPRNESGARRRRWQFQGCRFSLRSLAPPACKTERRKAGAEQRKRGGFWDHATLVYLAEHAEAVQGARAGAGTKHVVDHAGSDVDL